MTLLSTTSCHVIAAKAGIQWFEMAECRIKPAITADGAFA